MTDLVPQAVRDLLAFYSSRFPEVRFGDLDVAVLTRAVSSIDDAAQEVLAAEEALAEARARFRTIEGELSQKASRALSFLKIFVDGDEAQLAELDAISLSMPATRRKVKASTEAGEAPKRRARKSKATDDGDAEPGLGVAAELEALGVADVLADEEKSAAE